MLRAAFVQLFFFSPRFIIVLSVSHGFSFSSLFIFLFDFLINSLSVFPLSSTILFPRLFFPCLFCDSFLASAQEDCSVSESMNDEACRLEQGNRQETLEVAWINGSKKLQERENSADLKQ